MSTIRIRAPDPRSTGSRKATVAESTLNDDTVVPCPKPKRW
jgi:hypothetical protein